MNTELNLSTLFRMLLSLAACVVVAGLGLYPFAKQEPANARENLDNYITG